ncbi:MAG: Solitary outer membrane autotransporter beta-barrel domain [Halieaceae bacterium]|jgi:hypothetical protein|nr:Solitary outer membrane autotransporter beta-barrel domain [Halieaceae bacterium]
MSQFRFRVAGAAPSSSFLLACLLCATPALAQLEGADLEAVRDSVRETFNPSRAGIFYAASINFAVQPDIATANFSIDGLEGQGANDPELVNSRIPVRLELDLGRDDMKGFLQGTIGYQDLSVGFPFFSDGSDVVQIDWRSRGIDLGGGIEYAVNDYWTLMPSANVGVADLRNKADYGDSVLGSIFQPVFEGIIFDWETNAWIAGAALGARYERQYDGFRVRSQLSASANHIRSFDESSDDISIRDTASALDIEVNTVHPIGQLAETPVELVTILGATSLVGDARGELGFDEFFEFGLALQFDISRFDFPIGDFRIGAIAITGKDVSGWSLVIGRGI